MPRRELLRHALCLFPKAQPGSEHEKARPRCRCGTGVGGDRSGGSARNGRAGPTRRQSCCGLAGQALTPAELDGLLAPIALYPDQLLAQMLLCATDPAGVKALDQFLKSHPTLKGTELQDAALKDNFQPSFVALALFPQIVNTDGEPAGFDDPARSGIHRGSDGGVRQHPAAENAGPRCRDPQDHAAAGSRDADDVERSAGHRHRAGEPAGRVRSAIQPTDGLRPAPDDGGRPAGQQRGCGRRGPDWFHGGHRDWRGRSTTTTTTVPTDGTAAAYMYNDAWDDYYDHREDAREDWQDHREDIADERGDRAGNAAGAARPSAQETRPSRRSSAPSGSRRGRRTAPNRRRSASTAAQTASTGRGARARMNPAAHSAGRGQAATQERSGTRSDAFSGYSSGKSERAASTRGQSSRSSSRSRSGGAAGGAGDDQIDTRNSARRGSSSDRSGVDVHGTHGAFARLCGPGLRPANIRQRRKTPSAH